MLYTIYIECCSNSRYVAEHYSNSRPRRLKRLQIQSTKFYLNANYNEAASLRPTGGPVLAEREESCSLKKFQAELSSCTSFFFVLWSFVNVLKVFSLEKKVVFVCWQPTLEERKFSRRREGGKDWRMAPDRLGFCVLWFFFSLSTFLLFALFSSFLCGLTVVLWGSLGAMGQSEPGAFQWCGTWTERMGEDGRKKETNKD